MSNTTCHIGFSQPCLDPGLGNCSLRCSTSCLHAVVRRDDVVAVIRLLAENFSPVIPANADTSDREIQVL
jgi:hypothetical protein